MRNIKFVYFVKPAQLTPRGLFCKMASFAFRYSSHEIVQTECESSRGEESHVLLSECSSDISSGELSRRYRMRADLGES